MKIKYILAGALVAMFVIPGTASQLAQRQAAATPIDMSSTLGLFSDPRAEPTLSITLPTAFVRLDFGTHPLAAFRS